MCPSIRPPHPPRLSHSASVGSQHASAPTKKSHNKSRALSKRHLKNTHKKGFEGFLLRMAYAPPIESAARELKHCPNAAESACGSCRRVSLRPWASSSMCRTSSISRPLAGAGDIFRTRRLPPYYPRPLTPRPHSPTTHPPIHPHQATHRVVDRVRLLKPLNPGSINSATEYLRYQVYLTPEPPNPLSP